jgi:multidrug efflux pump subunit AcrA (membrane-fusion protein)
VDRNSVWIDTVVRGPLVRDVRGIGTLVPEDVRWIPTRTDARVERIVVWPGSQVTEDTVLLVLSSAELEQQARDSDAAVKSAQAKLTQLQAELEGELLERQAALTKAKADRGTAAVEVEVDDRLAQRVLIASLDFKKAQIAATELTANFEVEKQRYDFAKQSMEPRLAVAQGDLDQAKAHEVKKVASEVQKSPPQVALAWLLSKSTVTSVLLGASKLEQLENNLGSLNTHLSPDQIKRLDDISRVEMGFPHAILANPTIKQTISGGVEVHRN